MFNIVPLTMLAGETELAKVANTMDVENLKTYVKHHHLAMSAHTEGAKTGGSPAIEEYERMNRKLMVLTDALSEKLSSEEMDAFRDELEMLAFEEVA